MTVTVVIPALNEETSLAATLSSIQALRGSFEVIVVDGGSTDGTVPIAESFGAKVLRSPRGRGQQQAIGAAHATGDILWFLHADCLPDPDALESIGQALRDPRVIGGNFSIRFDGRSVAARQLTLLYPCLRAVGLCYGDSGIFVRRPAYDRIGGFQPFALFEDLDLVRRLKRIGAFRRIACPLHASSRRFENRFLPFVIARWLYLQCLFELGVHPDRLARKYVPVRRIR